MDIRTLRAPALVAAAAVLVAAVGIAPAQAGKPAPAPTGLAAAVDAHVDGSYDIDASWDAVAKASSYRVVLSKAGATLASATVTAPAWSPTVTATPGNASLSVRPYVGRKPGKTATLTIPLADVTPPAGSYSSTWDNSTGDATITQDALSDNAGPAGIIRTVDWGDDPATVVDWPSGTTIGHTYPLAAARYVPTVTLEDASGNSVPVEVPAIVIGDDQAPTGAFTVSPAGGWAGLTRVTVTQSAIHDDWTPDAQIARTVAWGDGTSSTWADGATIAHVYAAAGTYAPVVTIADEAHNSADVATSDVVLAADTTGPTVKLTLPRSAHSVKAWRTLRGKATDTGTGVKVVKLKAAEKRGAAWYGYNARTKKWVKAATKAKAFSRGKPFALRTDAQDRWSATLAGLRTGTLVYQVRATDKVGNRSAKVTHQAKLTRR